MVQWCQYLADPVIVMSGAHYLRDARQARPATQRRMWVEEMFGDLKGHGFDLEASRSQHFLHLSRLTLAVCLIYAWLMHIGQRAIKIGQRHLVDRHDRRDLSVFRIGWYLIEKRLALQQDFTVAFYPLLSGS